MIIPVGYAQISHFFGGEGLPNRAAVTYGVGWSGTTDPESVAALAHDAFCDHWCPQIANVVQVEETLAKFGPNATGPFGSFLDVRVGAGTNGMAPPNTAILVEKRTALGGRSGRGRMYIPGIQEPSIDNDGTITPGSHSAFVTAAAAFLARLETDLLPMVLFHNLSSDPTLVTSLTVDPVVATQRRRLR